jgi:hypothetical protein
MQTFGTTPGEHESDAMNDKDNKDDNLCKLVIELGHHWTGIAGEGIWARSLGDDLYEVDNIPFYAYGINVADVVRARAPSPDMKPVVERVERASGHRTVRLQFGEDVVESECLLMLRSLAQFHTSFEGSDKRYFAVDVAPDGDHEAVLAQLQAWESQDLLSFETCEARVDGGFGSDPKEDDEDGGQAG